MQSIGYKSSIFLVLAFFVGFAQPSAQSTIFGVKSCGSSATAIACPQVASTPPAHLFTFATDGSSFSSLGAITLDGTPIDVDGLAVSPVRGLLGFRIDSGAPTTSTLISIDTLTAEATAVGFPLGRSIRGAVFDLSDRLWVVDADSDEVLEIDPATGFEVPGTAFGLVPAITHAQGLDLAVRQDGRFYLVTLHAIFQLDMATGVLTQIKNESSPAPGLFLAGGTFSLGAGDDDLFAYEVNGTEDLFRYDVDAVGVPRTTLFTNIIPSFNAGRGDLAARIKTTGLLEDLANDLAERIRLLDLSLFNGPNSKANSGRRNALANRAEDAAAAIALGDIQSALDLLNSLLDKVDDQAPPADWISPSTEKTNLAAEVQRVIDLLLLL